MAVCLDYQSVYSRRKTIVISTRAQVAMALMLAAVLSVKVWIRAETTGVGYELARERQRTTELDFQRRELELERSVLKRPDVLERAAVSRLGLQPLKPNQARRLKL